MLVGKYLYLISISVLFLQISVVLVFFVLKAYVLGSGNLKIRLAALMMTLNDIDPLI